MLKLILFSVVIIYIPGVLLQVLPFSSGFNPFFVPLLQGRHPRRGPHGEGPPGGGRHGPPDFPHRPGGHRGPPEFINGPLGGHRGHHGHRDHGPPDFSHEHGHGPHDRRGHRPPPFNHGHRKRPHYDSSSEEDYDYEDFTTKRPKHPTTAGYKPLQTTTKPTTTTEDYSDQIDIRFGGDRDKRSTKSDPSTTELLNNNNKFNSLRHPEWNTPDPNFKPYFFYPSLTTCVEKKSECLPARECKILKRNPNLGPGSGFCKWVHDEPYVCCEKAREKTQNFEMKCGTRKTNNRQPESLKSQAIIGGINVDGDTNYPWMVAIGEKMENDTIDWYCGGALIAERTVITAAHCVSKRRADIMRTGELDIRLQREDSLSLQEIAILETLIHPLYRSPILYNDVALLYLEEPVKYTPFVQPICLPQKTSISETSVALLTGWGQLSFASERSTILQQVTVNIFNNSYCDQQYSLTQASKRNFPRGILDTQLCAGDEEGGKDACQGDSGAPLVTEEDGSFVLIGLVSAGIGCGSKTFPGVYTRISAFKPWILENIK